MALGRMRAMYTHTQDTDSIRKGARTVNLCLSFLKDVYLVRQIGKRTRNCVAILYLVEQKLTVGNEARRLVGLRNAGIALRLVAIDLLHV
jgi:hypothetical protein